MSLYSLLVFFIFNCFVLVCSQLAEGLVEKDLYQVLGLKENGENSIKIIKKAYRKLAQIHHPDKVRMLYYIVDDSLVIIPLSI